MKETPVKVHEITTPHFTMRIFARRSKFPKRCAHIAEVIPSNPSVSFPNFTFNNVKIQPWSIRSVCSWTGLQMTIKWNSPSRLLLSRSVAEALIPELPKRDIPPPSDYVVFDYYPTDNATTKCKESAAEYIIIGRKSKFSNNLPVCESQQKLILKWTANFGGVTFIDNKTLEITDWWHRYDRIGWLLLALRVATREYIVPSKEMEDAFQYFIDTGDEPPISGKWTATLNWQYHFETNSLPYFNGGMDEPISSTSLV